MCSEGRKKAPIRLLVDEAMSDDDSVISLPLETLQRLHLSHGDPIWLKKRKKGKQAISIAMADNDTWECGIEPKIRLNKVVKNELCLRIGDFVSVHRCPDDVKGEKTVVERICSKDNILKDTEFFNNLPDHILFEIFLRLPNCRSAVQYSCVNRRWSSIISSSAFIRSFIHHQDYKRPPFSDKYYCSRPFTLLFARYDRSFIGARADDMDDDPHYFEPFCQVFSEKSKALHGEIPSYYLSFLPCPVAIIASFDDLVVATSLEHTLLIGAIPGYNLVIGATVNYICNPLTKQWLRLPKVTQPRYTYGYGFVCEPATSSNDARYRLVMIGGAHTGSDLDHFRDDLPWCKGNEFVAKVFCSEIGQWTEFLISYPQHEKHQRASNKIVLDIVASNGILYWLEGNPLKGIIAFDPFNDVYTGQCRFIPLPVVCFETSDWSTDGKVCLGVVKGQLRLSQLYKAESYFVFRVWELKNYDTESPSWLLVYNLKLICAEKEVFLLSFHPNNTNLVFLLCGNDVCQYDILVKKYEKLGSYPDKVDDPWHDIKTYTLLYPSWPTPIPALPSS